MSSLITIFVVALYALFIVSYWSLLIRRAHDLGYSGWLTLLFLLPLVNLCMLIYFLCARGTEGDNMYGAPNVNRPFWRSVLGKEVGLAPAMHINPMTPPMTVVPPPPPAPPTPPAQQ